MYRGSGGAIVGEGHCTCAWERLVGHFVSQDVGLGSPWSVWATELLLASLVPLIDPPVGGLIRDARRLQL